MQITLADGTIDVISGVLFLPIADFNILSIGRMVNQGWTRSVKDGKYTLMKDGHTISSYSLPTGHADISRHRVWERSPRRGHDRNNLGSAVAYSHA